MFEQLGHAVSSRAIALAFAAFSLPVSATSQHNTTEPGVRFVNFSAFERFEWGTATIPFAEGQYWPGDNWEVPGVPSDLVPFGARWPDGSVRFAQLSALVRMQPGEFLTLPVRRAASAQPMAFQFGPWTRANWGMFDFNVVINTTTGRHVAPLRPHSLVELTGSHVTVLFRSRVPGTEFSYDLWLTFFNGQDHARFELRITAGNAGSADWQHAFETIGFTVRGAAPFVQHEVYHDIDRTPTDPMGSNAIVLLGVPDSFYDAQSMEWYGTLGFANRSLPLPDAAVRASSLAASVTAGDLQGVATNWPASGAFGPFGNVPDAPPWWTDGGLWHAETERAEHIAFVSQPAGSPWQDRLLGLQPRASAPGDQRDFGITQLGDIVRSGLPHRLAEARFDCGEEAMRPVHFLEANGDPVRSAQHPSWHTWHGRSHFDNRICPDRLGKPHPEPWLSGNAHGWTGKDNQHWSSIGIAVTYLLTRSHSLEREIDNEVELYLAGHSLPSQRLNSGITGIGASRSVGRTMLTMSWHYLCTGRHDLQDRLARRASECVLQQYHGLCHSGPTKPMRVYQPDPRASVQTEYWSPWQDGLAAAGLEACSRVTGSQIAANLAALCSLSLLWNGWDLDSSNYRVGYAISYRPGGASLTPAQYQDPSIVDWASSWGLRDWCMPATHIARKWAVLAGDQGSVQRADLILNRLIRDRRPQLTGRWDRYANWDGVQ